MRALIVGTLVAIGASAQAQDALDCSAFRTNADGTWTVTKQTTVKNGGASITLNATTFGRNAMNIGGTDLVAHLEQHCGRS